MILIMYDSIMLEKKYSPYLEKLLIVDSLIGLYDSIMAPHSMQTKVEITEHSI
jgi:hypothetical protein